MPAGVSRHFATIPDGRFGPRQVHYRRAGEGPAVLLFHQSPLRRAYQAHFAYPIEERLARVRRPTLLCAPAWDPQLAETKLAAAANPRCAFSMLPDDMREWGPAMLPFLDAAGARN